MRASETAHQHELVIKFIYTVRTDTFNIHYNILPLTFTVNDLIGNLFNALYSKWNDTTDK